MPVADLGFEAHGESTPGSGPIDNTSAGVREPQVGKVQQAFDSWRRKRPYQRNANTKDAEQAEKIPKEETQEGGDENSSDDDQLGGDEKEKNMELEEENANDDKNGEEDAKSGEKFKL